MGHIKGKIVLACRIIHDSKNIKEDTLIEILQKSTDRKGRPRDVYKSGAIFHALNDVCRDVAICSRGREVVVPG